MLFECSITYRRYWNVEEKHSQTWGEVRYLVWEGGGGRLRVGVPSQLDSAWAEHLVPRRNPEWDEEEIHTGLSGKGWEDEGGMKGWLRLRMRKEGDQRKGGWAGTSETNGVGGGVDWVQGLAWSIIGGVAEAWFCSSMLVNQSFAPPHWVRILLVVSILFYVITQEKDFLGVDNTTWPALNIQEERTRCNKSRQCLWQHFTSRRLEPSPLFNCEYKQPDTWLILLHFLSSILAQNKSLRLLWICKWVEIKSFVFAFVACDKWMNQSEKIRTIQFNKD